jgi:hypothetical protein
MDGVEVDFTCGAEGLEICEVRMSSVEDLIALVWPPLLARAAADPAVPDETLLRMIKDAVDHGVPTPSQPHEEEPESVGPPIVDGRKRLATLFEGGDWMGMDSTRRTHRMRGTIDRRFCGAKHLRTRDFGDSSGDEDGECTLM